MRMRKIDEKKEAITLEVAIKDFIGVKRAQMLGAETMRDYEAQLNRFLHSSSRNSTDYLLERGVEQHIVMLLVTTIAYMSKYMRCTQMDLD